MSDFTSGWGFPNGSRKCHWFEADGRSLCGRYGFYRGPTDLDSGKPGPHDCAACWKKLAARRAALPARPQGGTTP